MILIGTVLALGVGLSLGVFGAGGSILTVPLLHYIMGIDAQTATGASLLIVGITALAGTVLNARKGMVEFKQGVVFAVPSFFGVFGARTLLLPSLPQSIFVTNTLSFAKDTFILVLFAIVMIFAATAMIKSSAHQTTQAEVREQKQSVKKQLFTGLQGLLIGGLSGVVGAGGGFLIIPALNIMLGIEMKRAIATSLFIIAMNSAVGVVGDLFSGTHYPLAVVALVAGSSLAGMILGTRLSGNWDSRKLKPAFGVFILVIGAFIIAKELL